MQIVSVNCFTNIQVCVQIITLLKETKNLSTVLLQASSVVPVQQLREATKCENVHVEHWSVSCVWHVWAQGFGGADGWGAG